MAEIADDRMMQHGVFPFDPRVIRETPFDLTGQVVVLTGGAGILGREYSQGLVRAGARVLVADLDEGHALQAARQANDVEVPTGHNRGEALGVAVDVTNKSSVEAMVALALQRWGKIDALVNNAAIDPKFDDSRDRRSSGALEDYPLEMWQQAVDVNVTGTFLCAQAVSRHMRSRKRGLVVNVSSIYGITGPDQRLYESGDLAAPKAFKPPTYPVTKSAAIGFTRYLAAYWAGTGVRANTLTLGGVWNGHDEEFTLRYGAKVPMGRMAHRAECCGALLFLLSPAAAYVNGANLVVDGGWSTW